MELELSALDGGGGKCRTEAARCGLELLLLLLPHKRPLPLLSKLLAAGNEALLLLPDLPYSILSFGLPVTVNYNMF